MYYMVNEVVSYTHRKGDNVLPHRHAYSEIIIYKGGRGAFAIGDEEYSQKWVNLMSEKEFEEMKVFDVFNKQLNKLYEVRKQMPEGSDEAKEIDTMSQALRIDALQAISDISNE